MLCSSIGSEVSLDSEAVNLAVVSRLEDSACLDESVRGFADEGNHRVLVDLRYDSSFKDLLIKFGRICRIDVPECMTGNTRGIEHSSSANHAIDKAAWKQHLHRAVAKGKNKHAAEECKEVILPIEARGLQSSALNAIIMSLKEVQLQQEAAKHAKEQAAKHAKEQAASEDLDMLPRAEDLKTMVESENKFKMCETCEVRLIIVETEREAVEQDELEIEEHAKEVLPKASVDYNGVSTLRAMPAPPLTGFAIMDIFKLRITSIIPTRNCLFGTLIVRHPFILPQIIYSSTKANSAESLQEGAELLLTGPAIAECLSALDPIMVQFVDHPNIVPGLAATFYWDPNSATTHFDRPLYKTFHWKYGSVMMFYAVYSNGMGATVEVTLKNITGKDSAHIYGSITAENNCTGSDCALTLFSIKNSRQSVKVSSQQPIPLSRSEAVVPAYRYLIIRANLYCHDIYPGAEIAKGHAYFCPTIHSTYEENICGKYGTIQVKVTGHV